MKRTALVTLSGAALSFLLASGGHWLIYSLVSGSHESYKDDYVEISIIHTLVVLPLMAMAVGAFVATLLPPNQWWTAGVSLLPLLAYLLYESEGAGAMVFLCLIYLSIGILAALLVCWWRRRKAPGRQQHV